MSEASLAVAHRALERYNWEFAEGRSGVSDETRGLWVAEPVIVPLRAALEGTEYSGPTALDDFTADTRESWNWLRFDVEGARPLDDKRVLLTGTLHGAGREFGAETTTSLALLIEIEGDRVAAGRTFPSEQAALEAAAQ